MRAVSLLCILSALLVGCSSGGGDEEDSGGSASTGVRVLNTAMDLPPVSLSSTAQVGEIVSTTKFAQASGFAGLPKGDQTISVQTVDGGTGPFKFSITLEDKDRPQVLVYGTRETYGINATLIDTKKPVIPEGSAAIRIADGVTGASALDGSIGITDLPTPVSLGTVSKYVFVPEGDILIKLARSADGKIVVNQQVHVIGDTAYTFVASGEIDYFVIGNLLED